ncbi:MAG: hypothetical protein CL808_00175 [Citromicrobium sp.]|nr:hypothetical protein [Citromicrobium sp.]
MKLQPKTELDCLTVGSPEQRRQCAAPRGDLRYAVLAERQWRREAWAEAQHVKSVERLAREAAEAQREWDRSHRNFKVKREVTWGKEKGIRAQRHVLHRVVATHSAGGALPRYSYALTDTAGRLFVFQRIRYYSARNSKQGRGADAAHYAMSGAHILDAGKVCISSNVGDHYDEIVAAMDVAEGVNRTVSIDAKTLFHGIMQSCHDLTPEQQFELACDYAEYVFGRQQLPYLVVLHPPSAEGDQRNWHVHILYSLRPMTKIGEGEWAVGKYLRTDLDTPEQFSRLRFLWAETLNHACEKAGVAKRFTHLSYAAAGVDFIPQTHLGEGLTAKVRRGEGSTINEANHRIAMRNSMMRAVRDLRAKFLSTASHARDAVERLHRAATLALDVSTASSDLHARADRSKVLDALPTIPTGPIAVNDNNASEDLKIGEHSDVLPSGIADSASVTPPSLKPKVVGQDTGAARRPAIERRKTPSAQPVEVEYRLPAACPPPVGTNEPSQRIAVPRLLPSVISVLAAKHSILTRISGSMLSIPKVLNVLKPAKTGFARLQSEASLPRSPACFETEFKPSDAKLQSAYDRNLPATPQASPQQVPTSQRLSEWPSIPSAVLVNDEHATTTLRIRDADRRIPKTLQSNVDAQSVRTCDIATNASSKACASTATSETLSSQAGPVRVRTTEEKRSMPASSNLNDDASQHKSNPAIWTEGNEVRRDFPMETDSVAGAPHRDFVRAQGQERDEEEERQPVRKPNAEAIRLAAETFTARQRLLGILAQERHVLTKDAEDRVAISAALMQRARLIPDQIADAKMQDQLSHYHGRNDRELQEMSHQVREELTFSEAFWRPAYPVSAEVIDVFRRWRECPEVQEALRRTSLLPIGVNDRNDPDRRRNFFLRMLSHQGEDGQPSSTISSGPVAASQPKGLWPSDLGHGR